MMVWPVMNDAASLARNATRFPTSSGVTRRLRHCASSICLFRASWSGWTLSAAVGKAPGEMALTVTPSGSLPGERAGEADHRSFSGDVVEEARPSDEEGDRSHVDDAAVTAIPHVGEGGPAPEPRYVRQPFENEPDILVYSVNYDLKELLGRSDSPS
jgi:hypothetical protein